MQVYLSVTGDRPRKMVATRIYNGHKRPIWIQEDADRIDTRRWIEPGTEPTFNLDNYCLLFDID